MYLLTKKIGLKSSLREQIFKELVMNDYSKEVILKNKQKIIEFLPKNRTLNLNQTIKNMLTYLYLKGKDFSLNILSKVEGEGNFEIDLKVLYEIFSLITKTAFKYQKIFCLFFILKDGIQIEIFYNKKTLPKGNKKLWGRVCYNCKLKCKENGEVISLREIVGDRLSIIELAFL